MMKMKDTKYIQVVDCQPAANKKGLRIKVEAVELDEENNLVAMRIDYSGFRVRGEGIIEILQRNKRKSRRKNN